MKRNRCLNLREGSRYFFLRLTLNDLHYVLKGGPRARGPPRPGPGRPTRGLAPRRPRRARPAGIRLESGRLRRRLKSQVGRRGWGGGIEMLESVCVLIARF